MKKIFAKSRESGENHISIMIVLKPGNDKKKIKMATQKFISKLRNLTNGQVGFEYELILQERHN